MNYFSLAKFFLFIIPLNIVIISGSTLFPFIVGKYVWFRTGVDLALIFFLLGILFSSGAEIYQKRLLQIMKTPLAIAVAVFVAVFILAGFFGIDPSNSFWSNFERGEGGLQILHLGLFFFLLLALFHKESDWRKIFYCSIAGALLMILYGILALQNINGFVGGNPDIPSFFYAIKNNFRFIGSIGNSAYVAAYLIFAMFYTVYLFINRFNKKIVSKNNVLSSVIFIIFLIFFFLAGTRGAFLGIVTAVIAFLFYLAFSNQRLRKYLLVSILSLLILVVVLIAFKDSPIIKKIPGSRVFDVSISARTFQDRLIMWKIALEGFAQRPILGWGPENYYQVFDRHFNIDYFKPKEGFGAWFDRAHNVFLDHLVEAGILGLLSYISIFITFYWQFFKTKIITNNQESIVQRALLFALPVAYLVQGLMLFEVLSIYLNLFLFLAFATYYLNFRNQN